MNQLSSRLKRRDSLPTKLFTHHLLFQESDTANSYNKCCQAERALKVTKSFQESGLIQRSTLLLHFFGYFKLNIVRFKELVVFFKNQGVG
jgi:hypothetical protein